jgi:hypothetical protein
MTHQWTRMTYRIAMDHLAQLSNGPEYSGLVEVDGIVHNDEHEIGLHIGTTNQVDVTHLPTGKRIGGFDTLGAAMEFVHRVAYLRDWKHGNLTTAEHTAITQVHATIAATAHRPRRVAHE